MQSIFSRAIAASRERRAAAQAEMAEKLGQEKKEQ